MGRISNLRFDQWSKNFAKGFANYLIVITKLLSIQSSAASLVRSNYLAFLFEIPTMILLRKTISRKNHKTYIDRTGIIRVCVALVVHPFLRFLHSLTQLWVVLTNQKLQPQDTKLFANEMPWNKNRSLL